MPSIAGLVLAAGRAQRMGGRPKPLLELDGQPLIRRLVDSMGEAGVAPVWVVIPSPGWSPLAAQFGEALRIALRDTPAQTVPNPDPDSDLVGSQRLGLAAVSAVLGQRTPSGAGSPGASSQGRDGERLDLGPSAGQAVLIALADQPLVEARALGALLQAWAQRPAGVEMLWPRVDGEPGHPVVVGAGAVREVLASDARTGCKQWREAHPARSLAWDTGDEAYVIDLDTEQDLERFGLRTGRTLRWPDLPPAPAAAADDSAQRLRGLDPPAQPSAT